MSQPSSGASWEEAHSWESDWWGDCINTYGEETKQLVYAAKMGLVLSPTAKTPYSVDLQGQSVLDIGGGPSSLLLRCRNRGECAVVDPLRIPEWVQMRYAAAGIVYNQWQAEGVHESGYDEAWLYNVLEHTRDPKEVVETARRAAKVVRVFQWLDTAVVSGHIHTLTEEQMNEWLGGEGKVEQLRAGACHGKAYYGVFLGTG